MERSSKLLEKIRVDGIRRERKYKILINICNLGIAVSLGWVASSILVKALYY